ncbi:MAG: DUF2309 domain-containing protein [Cyclobacteriaceae bacterium]
MHLEKTHITESEVKEILAKGVAKIAPLWSLENFVAVNPYLGLSDQSFEEAMSFLHKSGKTNATLPIPFYLEAIKNGNLTDGDVAKALEKNSFSFSKNAEKFIRDAYYDKDKTDLHVKTLADVADEVNSKEWSRFMVDRISFWASAYFDEKQAIWDTAKGQDSVFQAWKQEAEVDFSTEAMGLKGFRKVVKNIPNDYLSAAIWALEILDMSEESMVLYINGLLMKMNGWAGLAARIDWDARLAGQESHVTEEFLTIALVWEMCIKETLGSDELEQGWKEAKLITNRLTNEPNLNQNLARQLVFQEAFDIANQRMIIEKINNQDLTVKPKVEPKVQAIFCIDVRSELYRRNLEAANEEIETMGFAGFFAFPVAYKRLGHDHGVNSCPVLLTTSHTVEENIEDHKIEQKAIAERKLNHHISKAWYAFRSGAVSCFSFVSPIGMSYLPKLFTDSFGLTRPVANPKEAGMDLEYYPEKGVRLDQDDSLLTGIPVEDRVKMATNALKAMSLTENFARIVLITGHGASTVNNPHATGLDCGACGGNSGEANAKVAAAVLNDKTVRAGLKEAGINVPESTIFVAALHDTTTDEVSIFNEAGIPESHANDLIHLKYALKVAGESARKERASRMGVVKGDTSKQVMQRSRDWSQVRPEWGLAGCSSFIVAPRSRTSQLNFGAKAFMHSYNWQKDEGFGVLELIMTAPMVVTSWINLQYYASSVDNKKFGSGNKTLHNVVGGLGVMEGFGGDLRVGLPWQSVHDGENYQHEPQRLNVIIEAPVDEMSKILEKHESIRHLCDNNWIYLFAMNDQGKVAYKYIGDLQWEVVN